MLLRASKPPSHRAHGCDGGGLHCLRPSLVGRRQAGAEAAGVQQHNVGGLGGRDQDQIGDHVRPPASCVDLDGWPSGRGFIFGHEDLLHEAGEALLVLLREHDDGPAVEGVAAVLRRRRELLHHGHEVPVAVEDQDVALKMQRARPGAQRHDLVCHLHRQGVRRKGCSGNASRGQSEGRPREGGPGACRKGNGEARGTLGRGGDGKERRKRGMGEGGDISIDMAAPSYHHSITLPHCLHTCLLSNHPQQDRKHQNPGDENGVGQNEGQMGALLSEVSSWGDRARALIQQSAEAEGGQPRSIISWLHPAWEVDEDGVDGKEGAAPGIVCDQLVKGGAHRHVGDADGQEHRSPHPHIGAAGQALAGEGDQRRKVVCAMEKFNTYNTGSEMPASRTCLESAPCSTSFCNWCLLFINASPPTHLIGQSGPVEGGSGQTGQEGRGADLPAGYREEGGLNHEDRP